MWNCGRNQDGISFVHFVIYIPYPQEHGATNYEENFVRIRVSWINSTSLARVQL